MSTKLVFGDPATIEETHGKPGEHTCPEMNNIAVFSDHNLRNSGDAGSCEIIEVTLPEHADSEEIVYAWAVRVSGGYEVLTVTGLSACPFCKEPLVPRKPEPLPPE